MSEHTPGPWKIVGEDMRFVYAPGKDGTNRFSTHVAPGHIPGYDDEETQQANARLIAAAPDLLAACKSIMRIRDLWLPAGGKVDPEHMNEVRALSAMHNMLLDVIAKAE